ncbi:hypothetical protein ASD45_14160 [Pseudolabrys sp. Root1462]|uniref:HdeA/HdeB family chaperone n=1 Tax=Pseudolabrys sp. Root1462 TaxID=1736466 RepID=UPI000703367E|nr:HdeA/HdeB family chaperone [Pseudolabrys sp. Root1462]KQZ01869.1 hypothetical protein ASD45_14160 [Pseudolabrys sp. Root1462]
MKKTLSVVLLAITCLSSLPVKAQQLDLSTVTCKDFVTSDKDTIGLIMMWLVGFYAAQDAKPIVDFDKMKENGGKLGEYCGKNPSHSLITAADDVLK